MTYEAYGAGGTGFILECLTDNLNRSASEVRAAVMKAGGKMADPGSVMFNFQRQGQVFVSSEASEDQVHPLSPNDCSQAASCCQFSQSLKYKIFPGTPCPALQCQADAARPALSALPTLHLSTFLYTLHLCTAGLAPAVM